MKIYSKEKHPERALDGEGEQEYFSVDVITCDEDGLLCIGYYNFDTGLWDFHTDTLVDYYEEGIPEMDFVWMYPPKELIKGAANKDASRTLYRKTTPPTL